MREEGRKGQRKSIHLFEISTSASLALPKSIKTSRSPSSLISKFPGCRE